MELQSRSDSNNYSEEDEKTSLAIEIERKMRQRGLREPQAAEFLGIDEHQLWDILRLKLARFSSEKLLNFCDALGKGRTLEASDTYSHVKLYEG